MKLIIAIALALFCLTATAQNQVVRRQGAKKPTTTSTTKKQSASTTTKKTSTTTKKTASANRGNKAKSSSSQSETLPRAAQQQISYQTFYANGVSFQMAKVVAGTFYMGATSEQQSPEGDETKHKVTLTKTYYLGKTEVTQALWQAVMGSNPSNFKGDNKPVECVSWNDCQEFISRLNAATGKNFRLPTEAEWEFAARGGNNSRHYQYSGSNNLLDVAWYTDNSSNTTHDVASKQANELGIYDMSGNVWEWCSDWYGSYSSNHQYDPAGATSGSYRVLRGGSWYHDARYCRSSYRSNLDPDDRDRYIGLRLALSE